MKNIHALSTDKPSRLHITGKLGLYSNGRTPKARGLCKNQHLYITDNEEIKKGDYGLCSLSTIVKFSENEVYNCTLWKKIILTTDQDLIKDGVQAIDDEFLEWFVNNPSCEKAEVNYGFFTPFGRKVDPMGMLQNHSKCVWKYKITISKRESKPFKDMLPMTEASLAEFKKNPVPMKKETIEEVAEKYTEFWLQNKGLLIVDAYKADAKWQQEQSDKEIQDLKNRLDIINESTSKVIKLVENLERNYSEEEVLVILHKRDMYEWEEENEILSVTDWFEQFKKK